MKTFVKIMLALSVLAGGTTVAWWFRKPAALLSPSTETAPPQASAALQLRDRSGEAPPTVGALALPQGVPLPGQVTASPLMPASVASAASPSMERRAAAVAAPPAASPSLPAAFKNVPRELDLSRGGAARAAVQPINAAQPNNAAPPANAAPPQPAMAAKPAPVAVEPVATENDENDEDADEPEQSSAPRAIMASLPGQASDAASDGWRTHKVVDGDTLANLATRYLGAAGRYVEILEANRQALPGADMLRIGTVLRIPPAVTMPAVVSTPAAAPTPPSAPSTASDLIPAPGGLIRLP